jgi:hypothetical protein
MEIDIKKDKLSGRKKALNILVGILLVPLTGYLAALVTEKMIGTFVSTKVLLIMVAVAIVAVIILHFAVRLSKFMAGAIVIGILISPYVQFLSGKINMFLTDPPNLRASVSVPEIRVQMGDLLFNNSEGKQIVALPAGGVKTLYPGKNTVNLGQLNLPAGNYVSGEISMKSIEVDVNIDLNKEVDLIYAQLAEVLGSIPSDLPADAKAQIPDEAAIKQKIAEEMNNRISKEMIAPYLPSFIQIKSLTKTDNKISMVMGAQIDTIKIPAAFPYPTGTGGPDVVLDITLNEIGLPVGIVPIIKLPPGAPAINIPNMAPDLGKMGIPADFGMPQSALDQIKAQIQAAVKQGEAAKAQAQ